MIIDSSYGVELLRVKRVFQPTVDVYRTAVNYCIGHIDEEWEAISSVEKPKDRFNYTEHLFHSTKGNKAKFDFDERFYKMPSYLRRAAISSALGAVSGYRNNCKKWEENDRKGKEPRLGVDRLCMPCFYNKEMFRCNGNACEVELKLLVRGDWVWVPITVKKTDADYLTKRFADTRPSSPTLERRYGTYYLRFAYKENADLSDKPIDSQRVCSVDLGINTDAVCCIMDSCGTILSRKFIDFPSDKDHVAHVLNRIRKFQRQNGSKDAASFWDYAKRINKEHAHKVARAIVEYAVAQNADVIVFEHLEFKGRKHGSKKQRLAMWRKIDVQNVVELNAHRNGIRISYVCAWGTSALAFDGSGKVTRDEDNHALATFTTGKRYNCDLSASYNIGARYFIRELMKPLPVTARSQVEANVPSLVRRTSCTLATLRELSALLAA